MQRCHGHAQHAGDRGLEPLVLIGDRQAHTVQPPLLERAQELDPERARLDLADIQADHLPHAGLVHRVGDHQRLGHHPPVVTHLDLFGVQPQVRVGALKRPLPERLDLLIQRSAHRAHAVLGHPVDPQLLHQPVDLPRTHAVHIGLEHDRDDRLLRAPPGSRKLGKYAGPERFFGINRSISPPASPTPAAGTHCDECTASLGRPRRARHRSDH